VDSVIGDILTFVQGLWVRAKLRPERALPSPQYAYADLMSSTSLIQVYMCIALARSFLNLDIMWNIVLEGRAEEFADEEEEMDTDDTLGGRHAGESLRRFRMRDDRMHRVYLPLTCAVKLCDAIQPGRLVYIAAEYLAEIIPLYSTGEVNAMSHLQQTLM
jgi:hypothetical protein